MSSVLNLIDFPFPLDIVVRLKLSIIHVVLFHSREGGVRIRFVVIIIAALKHSLLHFVFFASRQVVLADLAYCLAKRFF